MKSQGRRPGRPVFLPIAGTARRTSAVVLAVLLAVTGLVAVTRGRAADNPPKIVFGLGDEISGALDRPIYHEAPINMVTSWYNNRGDLSWMTGYRNGSTMSDLYGQGKAQELVIWLANDPAYAISAQFQADIQSLVTTFKGQGPNYGPLYVVLFTEFETYSTDPAYFVSLRQAYLNAVKVIHNTYNQAYVALGFGGYHWSTMRDLTDYEAVIKASDFAATQAMQACTTEENGQNIVIKQIRNAVKQLGSYGKPVMISHFKLWGDPACQVTAFGKFMAEVFTDASLAALKQDGLFAFDFMDDHYINDTGTVHDTAKTLITKYGSGSVRLPVTASGDINHDSRIDVFDLSTLLSKWQGVYMQADFNHDGVVNVLDLSVLLSHWTG